MRGIAILIVLLVVAFVLWSMFQGSTVAETPGADDLPIPDNPKKGIDNIADAAEDAPPWFFTQVAPVVIVGIALVIFARRAPKLFWTLIVGVPLGVFLVYIASQMK